MKHSSVFMAFIGLVACGQAPDPTVGETSQEIVNGRVPTNADFNAVVSWTGVANCSGTFIHPNYILTAAHCLPLCSAQSPNGCVSGTFNNDQVFDGSVRWVGRNGPLDATVACTGPARCGTFGEDVGEVLPVSHVFFPRASDFDPNKAPPDLALLHTGLPFRGKPIAVISARDLPSPSNLCSRYELTRPFIAGFSTNDDPSVKPLRRVGMAEVECDLDMDERAFMLDGHGRPFLGSRACHGDSGGPALWQGAGGVPMLGGVISFGDDAWRGATDNRCPSDRGETGIAFVPRSFIDAFVPSLTVTKLDFGAGTVVSNPAGISCTGDGSDCSEQYDGGTVVTLQAVAAPDSLFLGWSGACSGTGRTCLVSVSSATNVSARFVKLQQPLTVRVQPTGAGNRVSVNPPNTNCTGVCIPSEPYGTNVTLTAVPAAGAVFSKWSGACATTHSKTCTVQMTEAKSVTASFCAADDSCCINPSSCGTCNPKQCPASLPDCCL